ncbi:hypothetical protein ACWPKS_11820 [Coraliomargarita sp. W4R72]
MKINKKKRMLVGFCLLAGLMDMLSGALLMGFPVFTLKLMGVPPVMPEAVVFVRFVGAFVFAVGTLYLFAPIPALLTRVWSWLWAMLLATAWIRAVICLFTTVAIASGALSLHWWSVPVTDGSLAALQIWVLWKGWGFGHE